MKKDCGQGCLFLPLQLYCFLHPAQVHHQNCVLQFPSGAPSCSLPFSDTGWVEQFVSLWTSLPLVRRNYYLLLTTIYYLLLSCTHSVYGWRVEEGPLFSGWGGHVKSEPLCRTIPMHLTTLWPLLWTAQVGNESVTEVFNTAHCRPLALNPVSIGLTSVNTFALLQLIITSGSLVVPQRSACWVSLHNTETPSSASTPHSGKSFCKNQVAELGQRQFTDKAVP